jgi:hypothetical protein
LNGLGNTSGVNPQFRAFNEATFRLSGGPNIPSTQPARVLPNAPSFLGGLASIAESGGLSPDGSGFGGALGPIAPLLRQASISTSLNLLGIV